MSAGSIGDRLEKSDLLYDTLNGRYTRVLDRRKTLTQQASSLLTFGGIINTVLVTLITALSTNPSARSLLAQNPNHALIVWIIGAGFFFYILTAVFALLAFIEPKWNSAPVPLLGDTVAQQKAELLKVYANPALFSVSNLELQLINATSKNQQTNRRKSLLLSIGYLLLFLGIGTTGVAGYLLISGISLG